MGDARAGRGPQKDGLDTGEPDENSLLSGALRLLQAPGGHRAGTDAVLLAQMADLRPGDRVVDLGSGSGAVGLICLAREPSVSLTLVEREAASLALARRNVALNGMKDRVRVLQVDAFASRSERLGAGLEHGGADLVVTNPPFAEEGDRASPDPSRRAAHVMDGGTLRDWLATATDLLKPRGRLAMIHRADRLADCLDALRPAFGSIRISPVLPRPDRDAIRILVAAVKGARGPLVLAPPLVLTGDDGRFTPVAEMLHARPEPTAGA